MAYITYEELIARHPHWYQNSTSTGFDGQAFIEKLIDEAAIITDIILGSSTTGTNIVKMANYLIVEKLRKNATLSNNLDSVDSAGLIMDSNVRILLRGSAVRVYKMREMTDGVI